MILREIKPNVFFVDAPGAASNVFFLRTSEGVVLIDTTSSVEEIGAVMDASRLTTPDISLLINTHADGDHVGGNSLLDCPIYAHQTTYDRMISFDRNEDELPTKTFSETQMTLKFGEFTIELIHMGGHKPDQTILWLAEQKVLIASDLLFIGCHPYMKGCLVEDWITALKSLREFDAEVILPGHGSRCGWEEVDGLIEYFETGQAIAREHVAQGHTLEETMLDERFLRPEGWEREERIETNIEVFYQQAGG